MKLTSDTRTALMLAGGAILLLPLLPRLAGSLTRTVTRETGGAIIEAGKGFVVGAGEAVGIPTTNPVKCWDAMVKGETGWGGFGDPMEVAKASAYCDAETFAQYLTTLNYTQKHAPPEGYAGPLNGLRGMDAQAAASLALAGLMVWAIWGQR